MSGPANHFRPKGANRPLEVLLEACGVRCPFQDLFSVFSSLVVHFEEGVYPGPPAPLLSPGSEVLAEVSGEGLVHFLRSVEELFLACLAKSEDFFPICSPGSEELSENPVRLPEAPGPLADSGSGFCTPCRILSWRRRVPSVSLLWLFQPLSPTCSSPLGLSSFKCCRLSPA